MAVSNGKKARLVKITAGNIRNSHISVTELYDLLPEDCIAGARSERGKPIQIELAGVSKTVETDIARDVKTGKPRRQFRSRGWVRNFFAYHGVGPGDWLRFERLERRRFRLTVAGDGPRSKKRVLEFFAGIGLVRMGLEAQGWEVVFANDIDSLKQQMYEHHFGAEGERFRLEDIHRLRADEVPDAELATASFPCTDLSLAGARRGLRGRESSAFFGFVGVLEGMGERRPPLVMIENVLGFISSHGGRDFAEAMRSLNKLGYALDPFVLDAKWFVPQSRPRLFVIGSRLHDREQSRWAFRQSDRLRPALIEDFVAAHPEIVWSSRNLPDPPPGSQLTLEDIIEPLSDDAAEWWDQDRTAYLYNQMSPRHQAVVKEWIKKKAWTYGTVFRRVRMQPDGRKRSMGELRCDGLAGCLRTPKGGSGRQILFKAGYGTYAARLLTPTECARLMGADGFRIDAPLNQALFGFGDAVCVSAVSWIAKHYLDPVLEGTRSQQCGMRR